MAHVTLKLNDDKIPQRNVKGKRTRNPGYKKGDHWVQCDVSGMHIYASEARYRWDGMVVSPNDWEPRQPQDFVRGRHDKIAADEPRRPDRDLFVVTCPPAAVVGIGLAGCAVVGVDANNERVGEGFIPTPNTEL